MDTETTGLRAQSAAPPGEKSGTGALPSTHTSPRQSGIAITADGGGVSAKGLAYAKSRGISPKTLDLLGVRSGIAGFADGRREALFWPYYRDGEIINWKATAIEGGKAFTGMPGGKMCLHHQDDLAQDCIIVEGEWDMAALIEAGVPLSEVTTVPNGANGTGSGYGFIQDSGWMPDEVVLATDSDEVGLILRKALAQIFGPAHCWFVDFPDGCKDANDMLLTDGPEALLDLVTNGALPWPVDGLYTLSQLPEPAPIKTWDCGFPEWESKVALAAGHLSVVSGLPGHGKTQLWAQIWQQVAHKHDIKIAMASFETRGKPHHRRTLRSLLCRCSEKDMSPQQKANADAWIEEHYLWMEHPQSQPTLEWLLDTAEVAVVRHGAKVVQLDPWNRLEGQRDARESETDYIGRCLTNVYRFAQDLACHVQILAHPAKMDSRRRDVAPTLEDISGSAHWNNRIDQGFIVHREQMFDGDTGQRNTEATLYHRKARFEELGYPCKLDLRFNPMTSRYDSIDFETKLERDWHDSNSRG
jgi:twinkle protein